MSTSSCPRCGSALTPLPAGQFTLSACRACAGVFASNEASEHLAQKLDEDLASVATSVAQGQADMSAMPDGSAALACPSCNYAMERVVIFGTSVDVCRAHGTWFDAWELERVMRARDAARNGPSFGRMEEAPADTARAARAALYNSSAASVASDMGENTALAATEVIADVVVSGGAELAVEGLFAIITSIFD